MCSTRSAPGSSPRRASTADVSSTKSAIAPAVVASIFEQPSHDPLGPRAAECPNRIRGNRDHPQRLPLPHPLDHGVRSQPQLSADARRD
jgi:hypothetical protein